MRSIVAALFAAALFSSPGWAADPSPATSSAAAPENRACSANATGDIQYLVFWPPLPGAMTDGFAASIKNFAAKLGLTGDGKTRQLGFGNSIPIFVADEKQIAGSIRQNFEFARQMNVAVHFNVDDHIKWEGRPDLWNWYDPAKKGYNPANRKNVEWYDWDGAPNKRRYITPEGAPSQTPHMCYNSVGVQKEAQRIVSQVVGPALREELAKLKQEHKEYLFAGISVGQEAGFDDYSQIPGTAHLLLLSATGNPMARMFRQAVKLMDEDDAPHSRVGYCALTNAGYSKENPPPDVNAALTEINRKFIAFWDKLFVDIGIPCSRIYTHVAASSPQDSNNNAPIPVVFNPYARPGWTTYPQGVLAGGFQPLYDALAKQGNPAWGGVEVNAFGFDSYGASGMNWEKYLGWHFNHGATLVAVNVGAADPAIMSNLNKGAYGKSALEAYRKFLRGEKLDETRVEIPVADDSVTPAENPDQPGKEKPAADNSGVPAGLQEKIQKVQEALPSWVQEHGQADVRDNATKLKQAMEEQRFIDAESAADGLLKTMGK